MVLGVPRARKVPDVIRLGSRGRAGLGCEGEFRRPGRRAFEVVRGVAVILNASHTESVVERAAGRRWRSKGARDGAGKLQQACVVALDGNPQD